MVTALCAVTIVAQFSQIVSQHYQLSVMEASSQPLRETQRELDQMLQRQTTLRSRASMLAMLERMEQPVHPYADRSRAILLLRGWIFFVSTCDVGCS